MSTRSLISVQHHDGMVSTVYCHFDGYLSYNGKMLRQHYNSLAAAEDLVSGGDMSGLEANLADVEYYSRRGEDSPPMLHAGLDEAVAYSGSAGTEFHYIYANGEWNVVCEETLGKLRTVEYALSDG